MKITITTLLLSLQIILFAQEPVLVADFYPGSENALLTNNSAESKSIGETTLFPVETENEGIEMGYLKDGELAVLLDINPGADSGLPLNLTTYRGHFYFSARSADGDRDLWKSDGTPAGTTIFDEGFTQGMTISNNDFLYYFNDKTIVRTDGVTIDSIFGEAEFSFSFQPTDFNICPFNEEIAFLTQTSSNTKELYIVENNVATLKATLPAGSSFPRIYGMNQVGEDLLFGVDDPFGEEAAGSFIYRAASETVESFKINDQDITRLHNFTNLLALARTDQGFFVTNGVEGEELALAGSPNAPYAQGEILRRAVYQDKLLLATKPEFFGSYPFQITDGTTNGTSTLFNGDRNDPEFIMPRGRFAFFIYQYGFNDHRLCYVNMSTNETGIIYDFEDVNNFIGYPIAVQDDKIYFAARLDLDIGLELYSVDFNLDITSLTTVEPENYSVQFTNKSFYVSSENYSKAEVEIYSASGVLLEKMTADTNTPISLEHHTGFIVLHFKVNGEMTSRKFIRR